MKAKSNADLGKVKGIGEAKIAGYGEDMLRILSENLINDGDEVQKKEKGAEI